MVQLPVEIWVQVLDYLSPTDLLAVQRTSKRLLKISRDASIWRSKCFEEAPSAVHAFSNGDSLTDLLNGLSLTSESRESQSLSQPRNGESSPHISRRAKAIAKWDCTHPGERIDWYSEYIARHAPLTTEWLDHPRANEIRGMALFDNDRKVLSPMEDGSLRIWDVRTATSGRRSLHECAKSQQGLLIDDLCSTSGSSSCKREGNTGSAVDSTVVTHAGDKAYVAVDDILNEVDLNTMSVVSQSKYAWKITAISQQSNEDLPLMIGTSFSLQMHDPRISLSHRTDNSDSKLDLVKEEENTIFLPNYSKDWSKGQCRERQSRYMRPAGKFDLDAWAPVEPGPQTILHRGPNEIIVAGRMPSILFYDKRTFPQLQSVIHSGARLASLATIAHPPHSASSTNTTAEATLIAAGEYHGRGSLELYELPHHRSSDSSPSYGAEEEYIAPTLSRQNDIEPTDQPPQTTSSTSSSDSTTHPPPSTTEPYSYKNRQSSSSAKLLSVATQGTRIVYSDTEGKLHWVERDARGLARRWNINSYAYSHTGGAVVGEAVARKILTFNSDATGQDGMTRGDGDLLIWTGWDLAVVTSKVKWTGHDELLQAFEEKMSLEDTDTYGEGAGARSGSGSESRSRSREMEEEYARTMRRALERQADERRFLARFGRMR
ncbi:hypothetical protein LTR70_007241 [Exophiala xenobiotica]|uniref:Probable E3 ubiquitin ligase complex SCF subunit sconB n=1 Tax=Lithohypha guttulata TaxID=1690604 RepID=A0ABR0K4W6_9EURO|nr:hypothetical protein LTR24_006825 [Lithohypha guttulata]KAK5314267.1 hypothetical protein LTR70_007241 [Exophiala xenobiotica]